MRPKVNLAPIADAFAMPDERIIEFTSASGGGLIAIRERDGLVTVDVYRTDPTVPVRADTPSAGANVGRPRTPQDDRQIYGY